MIFFGILEGTKALSRRHGSGTLGLGLQVSAYSTMSDHILQVMHTSRGIKEYPSRVR